MLWFVNWFVSFSVLSSIKWLRGSIRRTNWVNCDTVVALSQTIGVNYKLITAAQRYKLRKKKKKKNSSLFMLSVWYWYECILSLFHTYLCTKFWRVKELEVTRVVKLCMWVVGYNMADGTTWTRRLCVSDTFSISVTEREDRLSISAENKRIQCLQRDIHTGLMNTDAVWLKWPRFFSEYPWLTLNIDCTQSSVLSLIS